MTVQRPASVLRVDEIGIALFATRDGAHQWELMRARMPGRFTTVAVRVPGDLVDVACDDRTHAQWLATLLHSWGVPKASLTITTAPTPAPAAG
ncbi:hypothetical protein AB0387_25940 [Streptomyces sp. NPDC089173]|uniref:hypothetical protein n=1 Tax=Streptomyces sp. NPDC089173 TaxID=3154965 RepID=UPI0034505775